MVYSTCSFHPLENEAVVARLLQDMQGRLELVDVKEMLPRLDYSPGLETWTPASKQGDLYPSFDSCPPKVQAQIRPYVPPSPHHGSHPVPHEVCEGAASQAEHWGVLRNSAAEDRGLSLEGGGEEDFQHWGESIYSV